MRLYKMDKQTKSEKEESTRQYKKAILDKTI